MSNTTRSSPFQFVLDKLSQLAMLIASVLMVALIFIFGWLVFGRYVLNATPTWVEQASLLIVVWITFFGAAVGIREGSHLSVEFIREALPVSARKIVTGFAIIVMATFGVIMAWQGYVMFGRTASRAIPLLGISEGWRAVPIIISGALVALFSVERFIITFSKDRES